MNENKNHNKTEVTVNVGRNRALFNIVCFILGLIVGFILAQKGCGDKIGIGNLTPNILPSGQTDVFAPPEEPVTGTITIRDTAWREKIVYVEVPRDLTQAEWDSIHRVHFAIQTVSIPIDDKNIAGELTHDITQGQIINTRLDYQLKQVSKTQWIAGTEFNIRVSPFEVASVKPFLMTIPKNSHFSYGVNTDIMKLINKEPFEVGATVAMLLNRKPKLN